MLSVYKKYLIHGSDAIDRSEYANMFASKLGDESFTIPDHDKDILVVHASSELVDKLKDKFDVIIKIRKCGVTP